MTRVRNNLSLQGTAFAALLFVLFFTSAHAAHAQEGVSVTITPPLFQLTIGPGEAWASSIKIVNNNTFTETYYPQVMDMLPEGENGQSKFVPAVDETNDSSDNSFGLAQWVTIPPDPITVAAGASADLPFSVAIPASAEPGGHYAAILVGTQPPVGHASSTVLNVSSYVSSLLFVSVKGNAVESGRIREFITSQSLYQTPKVDFTLRFENTGNIHVRPEGDITIYNMWGVERGQVLINQDGDVDFGNVLPQSIRRFDFSWEGDGNPFDIGLYSAVVTLAYGDNNKQNVTAKTYFWVVPVIPVAIGLGGALLFVALFMWFIRRYIRRALLLEQQRFEVNPTEPMVAPSIIETLIEPVREGVVDLRSAAARKPLSQPAQVQPKGQYQYPQDEITISARQFAFKYKLFLGFLLLLLAGSIALWAYFDHVLAKNKGFQITDVQIQAESVTNASSTPGPQGR